MRKASTLQKLQFEKIHFEKIYFGKIHFEKIHCRKSTLEKYTLEKSKSESCWSYLSENICYPMVYERSVTVQRHR